MLKLGFASAILPDLSLAEVLAFAAEAEYDCVEVMCWPHGQAERRYAGVTHINVTHFGVADATQVQKLVDQHGVEISALGYYPNPLTPDPDERKVYVDHIRAVIDAAQRLGLHNVNTFVGRNQQQTVEANWPAFLEVWPPLVSYAAERGVNIGIENCPMLFTQDEWPGGQNLATSPAIWRRMFADIPASTFGLNYDPSHMIWQMMDEVQPIYDFAPRLHHVHAKDARLNRKTLNEEGNLAFPLRFHTPKLPGLGEVRWGAFFAALTDVGYTGAVCVEVEDRAYEGSLADRKRALTQSCRYLRQFLGEKSHHS
ncbi:MAG: sugar phosphate isomerase/epimerase family protein [Chloroflexota bacterium]